MNLPRPTFYFIGKPPRDTFQLSPIPTSPRTCWLPAKSQIWKHGLEGQLGPTISQDIDAVVPFRGGSQVGGVRGFSHSPVLVPSRSL